MEVPKMKVRWLWSLNVVLVLALAAPSVVWAQDDDGEGEDRPPFSDLLGRLRDARDDRPDSDNRIGCRLLPSYNEIRRALESVVEVGAPVGNGGFNLNMWATVVNRDGVVCAVAFSGRNRGDQWPGSRVIAAQKANTANAFSLPGLALSTAQLFSAVQPGGSLFGLQESNPVDVGVAYGGNSRNYGQRNDPMVGGKIGGVNVFGGGLPLYNTQGELVGALGVSGDSSCADHNIAWKVRHTLNYDNIPGGVHPVSATDNIVYDIAYDAGPTGVSASGWGHPVCSVEAQTIGEALTDDFPVGPNP
jgi:uncharacterized protein GlcG (DUF336 family)